MPFSIGSLVPARTRAWLSGDREEWLLRELPGVKSKVVFLLDATDAILFCGADELLRKYRRLTAIGAGAPSAAAGPSGRAAPRPRILVGAEVGMWPEEHFYHDGQRRVPLVGPKGMYPRSPIGHPTPWPPPPKAAGKRVPAGTPFRYINIGLIAGPPADILAMLGCMQAAYPGFPKQCPGGRHPNGTWEVFSDAPHTTRFGVFHGHWGWEQSCFHQYYLEQTLGSLPSHCPHLALDYRADVIFNSVKASPALVLDWAREARPRINESLLPDLAEVRPCVLHANSASKSLMPTLQLLWEWHWARRTEPKPRGRHREQGPMPTERDLDRAVNQWQKVSACNQEIPVGGMRKPAVCGRQAHGYFRQLTGALKPAR